MILDERATNGDNPFQVQYVGAGPDLRVDKYPSESGEPLKCLFDFQPGETYHVVYIEKPGYRAFYINGLLDADDNAPETYNGNPGAVYAFGKKANNTSNYLDGSVDEFSIHNSALTAQQISDRYSAGTTVFAGGSQEWTPSQVPTASWIDLSEAANYTEANGKVSTIADLSGSGLTLSQSTTSWQPTLSTINGLTAIQGSGSEYMISDIGVSIDGGSVLVSTVVSADNFPDDSGDYEALFEVLDFGSFSVTNRRISNPQRENLRWAMDGSTRLESDYGSYPQIGTAPSVLTFYVIDGQEAGIRLNGTRIGYTTDPSKISPAAVSGALRLFINTNFSSLKKWRGKLGEMIVENNCDSLAEIEKREGYLAHKWQLADFLPNDHAYKSATP